jgi:predicted metal-dependent phosphotriesterase family hydrolase
MCAVSGQFIKSLKADGVSARTIRAIQRDNKKRRTAAPLETAERSS